MASFKIMCYMLFCCCYFFCFKVTQDYFNARLSLKKQTKKKKAHAHKISIKDTILNSMMRYQRRCAKLPEIQSGQWRKHDALDNQQRELFQCCKSKDNTKASLFKLIHS